MGRGRGRGRGCGSGCRLKRKRMGRRERCESKLVGVRAKVVVCGKDGGAGKLVDGGRQNYGWTTAVTVS